ncbi:MAG: hypothetical protein Tsb0020_03540 [Haliangiales bacterium]
MQWSITVCLAAAGWLGCTQPSPTRQQAIVHVASTDGLSSLNGDVQNGSSSQALELIYANLLDHAHVVAEVDDEDREHLVVQARDSSPYDGHDFCDRLRDRRGLVAADADAERCTLRFANAEAKRRFLGKPEVLFHRRRLCLEHEFAAQPVAASGQQQGAVLIERAELRPCPEWLGASQVAGIDLIEMSLQEAWRKLLARRVDVLPSIPWLYRNHFLDVASVHIEPIPVTSYITMFFDMRHPGWADPDVRRRVASLINPADIAAVACGDVTCAVTDWHIASPSAEESSQDIALPPKIVIQILETRTPIVSAARAISYWLRRQADVEVVVEPMTIAELAPKPGADGAGGAAIIRLVPLRLPDDADLARLTKTLDVVSSYASAAYAAAIESDDRVEIQSVLEDEVPIVPLYALRQFAAVDKRFCGGIPERATSWAWIAELRPSPCDSGGAP